MKNVKWFLIVLFLHIALAMSAQDSYMTRNGKISFFSSTPLENIDAVNNEVLSVVDLKKGEIAFALLVNSFHFQRALMEEHFNENYMESTKFPKATFSGKFAIPAGIDLKKNASYPVQVEGELTIHGVTKKVAIKGELITSDGKLLSKSAFELDPKDFHITIPSVVAEKIAEVIKVTVDCSYSPKQ